MVKSKVKIGDKVLCEHKGYKYAARVLDSRRDPNSETSFFVHYQGWNKNWDEWVSEKRVHQFNEADATAVKTPQTKAKGAGVGRKKSIVPQDSASESTIAEPTEPIPLDKEVKIKLPDELKDWLVDDDNNIRNKKLTLMPARVTISTILKDFIVHKKASMKSPGDKELILNELTLGIKDYFNVMLGAHLLYKFERLQYQLLLKEHGNDVDLTGHYGVIHLVRLFTKIGKPLAASTLDQQNVQTIVGYIQDLLRFISKQPALFDLDRNYIVAPPEYMKNALK